MAEDLSLSEIEQSDYDLEDAVVSDGEQEETTRAGQAPSESPTPPGPKWSQIEQKVRKKLHHVRKELKKCVKKGKGFETQKLVKKVRSSRSKVEKSDKVPSEVKQAREKELQKLETDLDAIKRANLDAVTYHALLSHFKSPTTPPLPCVENVIELLQQADVAEDKSLNGVERPPLTKVEIRVQGSKAVQDGLKEAVEELRRVMVGGKKVKGKPAKATQKAQNAPPVKAGQKRKQPPISSDMDSDIDGHSDISLADSLDHSDAEADGPAQPKSKASSTFITSLADDVSDISVSDYSNSDFEADIDYDISDDQSGGGRDGGANKKRKKEKAKNRMGQRARREMWEKMYGARAKHVQDEEKKKLTERFNPTTGGGTGGRGGKGRGGAVGRGGGVAAGSDSKQQDESLHPSWQAKKLQKASAVPFAGKKVVFGDDGGETKGGGGGGKDASAQESLHPSWEAKRKAKEAQAKIMSQAKPTKITFGDD
ncbi:hypothetical protein HDV00_007907 [Rhizophlyctis rosea]|nr:hypothetical protein HDV00_007907 [Rhizophlyctis rosea]